MRPPAKDFLAPEMLLAKKEEYPGQQREDACNDRKYIGCVILAYAEIEQADEDKKKRQRDIPKILPGVLPRDKIQPG
jgi:hypothetical protein